MILWLTPWERPAYYVDLYRLLPRVVLAGCAWMTWHVTDWFMALTEPTIAQGAFVSVVYGAIPLILNFYMQNGVNWEARRLGLFPPTPGPTPSTVTTTTTKG